jgi:hypothetical protein
VAAALLRLLIISVLLIGAHFSSDNVRPAAAERIARPNDLSAAFANEVAPRLFPPPDETQRYARMLNVALSAVQTRISSAQIVVLVDRNPKLQALFVFYVDVNSEIELIGATSVSTGRIGEFDYFETPVGVFEHSIENPDFRAEGTKNEFGIRGYGVRGMRVYDFGWQQARKGWGDRGFATMRLQMHATDPTLLEPKLGTVQSKGCIRISASLNRFIDRYGLLDADYESALRRGSNFWVLDPNRAPTPWSGRYLVVVDSERATRPTWSQSVPATARAMRQANTEKQHNIHAASAITVTKTC